MIAAAKRIGMALTLFESGRRGPKTTEYLRIGLLERCYGPNLGVIPVRNLTELDARIVRAVDCKTGLLGKALQAAQHAIQMGNEARAEYLLARGRKTRNPVEEDSLYAFAREWFRVASAAQERAETDAAIRR